MNRILELRQKQTAAIDQAAAVLVKAREEKRALNSEEQTKYDQLFAEASGFRSTIQAEENQAELEKALADRKEARKEALGTDAEKEDRAFVQWIRGGPARVDEELRGFLYPGNMNAHDLGLSQRKEARAAQTALDGAGGGYTVPEGFWPKVIEAEKFYGGMLEVGPTVINTSMGNDLPIPTSNDTANKGRIIGESSPVTQTTVPFGQVILRAFKYTSDVILVPLELLQDSGINIEAFLIKRIAERLGRIKNEHFTTGTGTGQPQGVVTAATLGKAGLTGQATSIIYNDLIDLKYSVNRAYRRNGKWMMADPTLAAILKLVDDNDRPLILDYLRTLQAGEPEQILGQQLVINDDMAVMAANAKSVLYGSFENYWVRRVMAMLLMRLVERYADNGQVGFLAFERADGRMVDAGTHPIKYYANSAS